MRFTSHSWHRNEVWKCDSWRVLFWTLVHAHIFKLVQSIFFWLDSEMQLIKDMQFQSMMFKTQLKGLLKLELIRFWILNLKQLSFFCLWERDFFLSFLIQLSLSKSPPQRKPNSGILWLGLWMTSVYHKRGLGRLAFAAIQKCRVIAKSMTMPRGKNNL